MAYALPDPLQDTNGNVIAGATITVKKRNSATTVATFTTDSSGMWDWSTLNDGIYDITYSGATLSSSQTFTTTIQKNSVGSQTVTLASTISSLDTGVVLTAASAVTITSTPSIAAGQVGQRLTLIGTSDTNTVTLQSQNNLASSTLKLKNGQNFTLGLGDRIVLDWDDTNSLWEEVTRSDNFA